MKRLCAYLSVLTLLLSAVPSRAADFASMLADEATQWIAEDLNQAPTNILVRPPDRRARLTDCTGNLQFEWPFPGNTRTVMVSCADPSWRYYLQVRFDTTQQGVAAARSLSKGHQLNLDDLQARTVNSNSGEMFTDATKLVGQILIAPIDAGDLIRPNDLAGTTKSFQTTRAYQRGELIKLADLEILESNEISESDLNRWPSGLVIAQRALEANARLTPGDIEIARQVVTARKNILRHQIITETDVVMETVPVQQVQQTALIRHEAAVGFEATRTMNAGTIITRADIKPATLIREGENVTLTITRGALTLTVETVALENAQFGEQVRLLNRDSQTEIVGIVSGRGRAQGR